MVEVLTSRSSFGTNESLFIVDLKSSIFTIGKYPTVGLSIPIHNYLTWNSK